MTKPVARMRTVYDLLDRVCQHILEEPRRYYQGHWILRGKPGSVHTVHGYRR